MQMSEFGCLISSARGGRGDPPPQAFVTSAIGFIFATTMLFRQISSLKSL
jgi:hypothetical protein